MGEGGSMALFRETGTTFGGGIPGSLDLRNPNKTVFQGQAGSWIAASRKTHVA